MKSKTENKLDGLHFYKLFKHHFDDFKIPLKRFGVTPQHLDYDGGLYITTIETVSYYLGELKQDCQETGCYQGPVYHHINHILNIINSDKIQRLMLDTETVDFRDWIGRQNCYKLISHLGKA